MHPNLLQVVSDHLGGIYSEIFMRLGRFEGSYIAGGAIASVILGEKPKDYDVWFETEVAWSAAVSRAKLAVQAGMIELVYNSEHAFTFKVIEPGRTYDVQLVKSRVGEAYEVVEMFDFRHTQAFYYPDEDGRGDCLEFVGKNTPEFIQQKVIAFDGTLDWPIHTLSRLQKFALRGYKVPDQALGFLIQAIRSAPLHIIDRDLLACGKKYSGGEGAALQYAGREAA